ncbi:NAD(P)/FAD-dependent oxidoreductase [Cumulibacter soli]|uniref:NAD(P)/FAD-dependent oxidoreductase n=1 Tax=Cumulibacter soli TaxID=2546344 RepID=UPI001067A7E7|nr:FAD-dependent oxidoreductase [Cumulibacter soli]
MSASQLVVVGAGLAGLRACEAARRAGFTGIITLIGAEQHLPYDRPPLSKEFLDEKDHVGAYKDEEALRDELRIELKLGTRATGLNRGPRLVRTSAGDVPYDELIIATGADPRVLPGDDQVVYLRTLDDAHRLRDSLARSARVLVIGAGFIGSEVASAARARGLSTTVVEALDVPLVRSLGAEVGGLCTALHRDAGVDLRLGVRVDSLERTDGGVRVELSDGTADVYDLVVSGIGAVPATSWLADCGLQLAEDGGIVCDENLAVLDADDEPVPHIWAAGDVASWVNPLFGTRMRLEHWSSAGEQGGAAARNALGEPTAYSTVPYFWSDWFGTRIQFVGVPDGDEVVVQQRIDKAGGTVVLYRRGDRLIGAFTIGRPDLIMKYRRLIAKSASWSEGLEFGAGKIA